MKSKFLIAFLSLVAMSICAYFFPHAHHAVLAGIPMLAAQDLRIAYTNAYRTLWKKATNDGSNKNPSWLPNTGNKILSQSDLISEIALTANRSNYQFGINVNQLQNGQPIYNTERRLNLQDTFFASQIGYYMRVVSTYTGNPNYQNHLFTHPAGQFYGSGTYDPNIADSFWNGSMQLSINNRTVVPEWDLWRHYETPQTQYPTFVTSVGTQQYPVNDEHYGAQSGMFPIEPMWVLDGSYDNTLTINFNNSLASIISGSLNIHMVVVLRGILAQNCGKIMEPGLMNPA